MPRKKKKKEDYWRRRNEELEQEWARKSQQEIEKELTKYYQQALDHIQKNVNDLYARFATENGLSSLEAQRLLQGKEFRTWRMDMKEYLSRIDQTGDRELLKELNTLVMRSRITRFDKLYGETLVELAKLAEKTGRSFDKFLPSAYKDFYYRNLYEIAKEGELRNAVSRVDPKRLEEVLRVPWSGKNYSERIWRNDKRLAETIQQTIVQATHRGTSVADLSRMLAQKMGVGISDATRLVRTELNYVQNRAALDGIQDAGFEYYRVSAAFDARTCSSCASKDGMVVPIDKADPGDTVPPFHARCRCSISASFGEGKDSRPKGTRSARNESGKTIHIPADMKYEEWKSVYIDKSVSQEIPKTLGKSASVPNPRSAIIEAEKNITDIKAEISARQTKIDALEAQRENIDTIAEASAITRKQQTLEDEIRDLRKKLDRATDDLTAQKNIEKYGDPYGFNKIEGRHTRRQDLKATNPNFDKGSEWTQNCQRCVATYELRRRGYDVIALPRPENDDLFFKWSAIYRDPQILDCSGVSGDDCRRIIEKKMLEFGDGARAVVAISCDNKTGHVFIAEQIRGRTYFLEPQSGIWYKDPSGMTPFTDCDPRWTQLLRIDDITFNQRVFECAKDV